MVRGTPISTTFTAAKEKVVKAGWALLPAAKHCAPSSSADDNLDPVPRVGKKEKKQKKNSRNMRNKHGWQVGGDVDAAEPDVCVVGGDNVTESAVELPVVLCDHCVTTGDDIHPTMDWKTRADTGSFHPDNDEQKHRNVHSNRTVICWLQVGVMDVDGRYTIPKKTRVASGDK